MSSGGPGMIRRLVIGTLLAGVAVLLAKAIPDVARYMKIRSM